MFTTLKIWISVASIVNNQTNLVVLIKNSLGYSRFEGLESKFNALKPMNFSIEFKYNRAKEQHDTTNCGVFAIQNLNIIAEQLNENKSKFINEFELYNKFCTTKDAEKLRKTDFANKFALNIFFESYKEKIEERKRELINENHDSEIDEIVRLMNESTTLKELIPDLCINSEDESTKKKSILIKMELESDVKDNYNYKYRLEFNQESKDLMNEIKTILSDILKLGSNSIEIDNNLMKIDNFLVKNIKFKEKVKTSDISTISNDEKKLLFATSLSSLNIDDSEFEKCFDILKESRLFDNSTIDVFNESLKEIKMKIETKESEMTSQENKLRELGYNEDDIEKILNVLKK